MWTGFAVDVSTEAMVQALEIVVPMQVRLGEVFCAPAYADCRPRALDAIELADAAASAATVTLTLAGGATLTLLLLPEHGTWQPEPQSLTRYLAACRGSAE